MELLMVMGCAALVVRALYRSYLRHQERRDALRLTSRVDFGDTVGLVDFLGGPLGATFYRVANELGDDDEDSLYI